MSLSIYANADKTMLTYNVQKSGAKGQRLYCWLPILITLANLFLALSLLRPLLWA